MDIYKNIVDETNDNVILCSEEAAIESDYAIESEKNPPLSVFPKLQSSQNTFESTSLVPVKALYTLDGVPLFDVSVPGNIRNIHSRAKNKNSKKLEYENIMVFRKNSSFYYVVSGLYAAKIQADSGKSLVFAKVFDFDKSSLDEALSRLAFLKTPGQLHFFDYADNLDALIKLTGATQKDVGAWLGVSQPSIGNKLRLTNLSPDVRHTAINLRLSERHCRALLNLPDEKSRLQATLYSSKYAASAQKVESICAKMGMLAANGLTEEDFDKKLAELFQYTLFDVKEELASFIMDLQRNIRILRSLNVDISYTKKETSSATEFVINIAK